jgi:dihydrodipicolinate synthase/N-acetylneuraminate lyase
MCAHLRHLSKHVRGILVPGSTGDGWELTPKETQEVLEIVLGLLNELDLHLLIGDLKPSGQEVMRMIQETMDWLKARTGEKSTNRALSASRVTGFTICPPCGKSLSQDEIERGLTSALETGLPIAIYQLPQITQNEIGPELARKLAREFGNFLFFKDSSGADRVVQSEADLGGVFTMRGAEGSYARWVKTEGGPYDGFLLSTANCFARELHDLMNLSAAGKRAEAHQLSDRLTAVINEVFALVKELPDGNPFANANKAMDHFFAHGERAASMPAPRLHAGSCLPEAVLQATGYALERNGFSLREGYRGSA